MKPIIVRCGVVSVSLILSVTAIASDPIPRMYRTVALSVDVPADILYAVALTESGRAYRGKLTPWPWALNIAGDSVICDSYADIVVILNQTLHRESSVDIGVMQINWRWHRQRFANPIDAVSPAVNLRTGAAILREQYERTGNWWHAVERYHAPGEDRASRHRATRYRQRVQRHWDRLSL